MSRLLFLDELEGRERRLLHRFDRGAAAIWSPASDKIALADYEGSTNTECYIFFVNPALASISVRDVLKAHPSVCATNLAEADRAYIQPVKWVGRDSIELQVEGADIDHADYRVGRFVLDVRREVLRAEKAWWMTVEGGRKISVRALSKPK